MADENTKKRIILAAGPIFARKGFRAATIREICDAAEVNLASVNYYFGDKRTLYAETLNHAQQMQAQQFPDLPADDANQSIPPDQKLHHLILTMLNRVVAMRSEPWPVRLIMREILQPTEAFKPLVERHFLPMFNSLLAIVDELLEIRLPDWQRRQIGMSIIGQCLHYRFSAETISIIVPPDDFREHFQIEQLADHITQFSLAAITAFANAKSTLASSARLSASLSAKSSAQSSASP